MLTTANMQRHRYKSSSISWWERLADLLTCRLIFTDTHNNAVFEHYRAFTCQSSHNHISCYSFIDFTLPFFNHFVLSTPLLSGFVFTFSFSVFGCLLSCQSHPYISHRCCPYSSVSFSCLLPTSIHSPLFSFCSSLVLYVLMSPLPPPWIIHHFFCSTIPIVSLGGKTSINKSHQGYLLLQSWQCGEMTVSVYCSTKESVKVQSRDLWRTLRNMYFITSFS